MLSFAVDSANNPHISYFDGIPNNDLKYAFHDSTTWQNETVDGTGNVGWFSSIAIDQSNRVHISYYDV